MTVALQFTPLYGAEGGAICCLLQIGSVNILLDCGWDSQFDRQLLQPLLRVVPKLDLVLLSQPDLNHLGALPLLAGKDASLTAPVYAAAPVKKLGHIFFHDCYTSQWAVSDFSTFDADDIDAAFKSIKPLKHHQLLELELQGLRLRLVGYPAGHMIGGTVWSIESGGEVLVYGPATNHMKERHLRGGQLSNVPVRPALLVSGPGSSSSGRRGGPLSRAARDQALLEALREVFSRGGNVLLPVDSSARMLELLLVLDHFWHTHKFVYHLGLLSYVADSAVRAAAGCLEWMGDELQRDFNSSSINPLACRHVKRCHNVGDVARLGPSSKVVVATGLSLEGGLSRELLVTWGADARNAVIFTQPPPVGSLGDQLLRAGAARPIMLQLALGHREPLTGLELEEFEAKRAEEAAAAAAAAEDEAGAATGVVAAAAAAAGDMGAAAGLLPLRESSEAIRQLRRNATGALEQVLSANNAAAGFDEAVLVDEGILMEGFGPPPGATYCMFPDEQELLVQEWDQYGAVMDTSALRVEEAELEGPGGAADEEDMDLEEQGPTKVVVEQVQLPLSAAVALTEGFAGLSDPASLATIVGGIAPRCLLLLGGSAADTSHLAGGCASKLGQGQTQIVQPGSGQEVRLRLASSYRLCISQTLLDSLSRHKLGIYDVAWLDGVLAAAATATTTAAADGGAGPADDGSMLAAEPGGGPQQQQQQQQVEQAQQQQEKRQRRVHWLDGEELLTVVPPAAGLDAAGDDAVGTSMDIDAAASVVSAAALTAAADAAAAADTEAAAAAAAPNGLPDGSAAKQQAAAAAAAAVEAEAAAGRVGDHGGIFIGDVQLSAVKAALAAAGIASNFQAGRLVVRGCGLVVSRERGDGGLQLEGSLSEEYFRVRDIVYGLYNIC